MWCGLESRVALCKQQRQGRQGRVTGYDRRHMDECMASSSLDGTMESPQQALHGVHKFSKLIALQI